MAGHRDGWQPEGDPASQDDSCVPRGRPQCSVGAFSSVDHYRHLDRREKPERLVVPVLLFVFMSSLLMPDQLALCAYWWSCCVSARPGLPSPAMACHAVPQNVIKW